MAPYFACVRVSGHADQSSVLQGWWPARSSHQRAAGGSPVPPAALRPGTGPGERGACGRQTDIRRPRLYISFKFMRRSRGETPRLCWLWTQRLEGNHSLMRTVWGRLSGCLHCMWSNLQVCLPLYRHDQKKSCQKKHFLKLINKLWNSRMLPSNNVPLEGTCKEEGSWQTKCQNTTHPWWENVCCLMFSWRF